MASGGVAQELKERGSQWPTVAGAGEWGSLAFRRYVDTAVDVSMEMDNLLIGDFDVNESDGES